LPVNDWQAYVSPEDEDIVVLVRPPTEKEIRWAETQDRLAAEEEKRAAEEESDAG
jgi:hypothetical protein